MSGDLLKSLIIYLLFAFWLFNVIPGCETVPDPPGPPYNPLDPDNPGYTTPLVTIISGPENNETIFSDVVSFQWQGNQPGMDFRFCLDNKSWSSYSSATSATIANLDEFEHTLKLQGRYSTGTESDTTKTTFTVDALEGPALLFYPKAMDVLSLNQFTIDLWLDETTAIAGFSVNVQYDQTQLILETIDWLESTSFLLNNGGRLISFQEIDNTAGVGRIDCVVVEGSPRNVQGTGKIARLTFRHLAGSTADISIAEESELSDSEGVNVEISTRVGARITIN